MRAGSNGEPPGDLIPLEVASDMLSNLMSSLCSPISAELVIGVAGLGSSLMSMSGGSFCLIAALSDSLTTKSVASHAPRTPGERAPRVLSVAG